MATCKQQHEFIDNDERLMLDRPDLSRTVRDKVAFVKDRGPSRSCAAVFFGLVGGLVGLIGSGVLSPDAAWATHETDHRFTISGSVRDKDGKPARDVKVMAKDLRDLTVDTVTSYTDGSGFYTLLLHLHNSNLGDSIHVSVKDERFGLDDVKKIRAEFDPGDKHVERQATVAFGPGSDPSGGETGTVGGAEDRSKLWVYGVSGVLVAAAIGVAVTRMRHRQAVLSATRRGKKR